MKYKKEYLYPLLIAVLSFVSIIIGIILDIFWIRDAWFLFIVMSFILAIVAFIYSIFLLIKYISQKNRFMKNYIANILAILLAGFVLYGFISEVVLYRIINESVSKQRCGTHLSGLGKSIMIYSNDNKYLYPDPNSWCDLLILFADAGTRIFLCDQSNAIVGESSYAMNINLKGKTLEQVDLNTVVLFETIYGKDPNGRNVNVSSRYSYKVLKEKGEDVGFFGENHERSKVYKNRWNQAGGPGMLTAENHKDKGANILFADGSVRWIPKEDFNNLNWGQETTEPNIE